MAQLGTVLMDYPEEVVVYVTSPQTGIQRRLKWPPTISEVIAACDDHRDFLARQRAPKVNHQRVVYCGDQPAGHLANVWVGEDHPRYKPLCAWAETADPCMWKHEAKGVKRGLWVALDIWDGSTPMKAAA